MLVFFQILYLFIFSLQKKRKIKNLLIMSGIIFSVFGFFFIIHYALFNKLAAVFNTAIPKVNNLNPFLQIANQLFYDNYIFFLIIVVFLLLNFKKVKRFIINEITINSLSSPFIYLSYIIISPIIAFFILDKYSSFLQPKHIIFIVPASYMLISFIVYSFDTGKELIKTIFLFSLSLTFLLIYLFLPQNIR